MEKRFIVIGFFLFIITGVFIAGCSSESTHVQPNSTLSVIPATTPTTLVQSNTITYDDATSVIQANNQFAFDLYANLRKDPKNQHSNLFFSPFSISYALAMTYEGARGKTADEIASVFHFPADKGILRQQYSTISAGMNTSDCPYYCLIPANALWVDKIHQISPDYQQTIRQFYGANVTNLDFGNSPENSRRVINTWIENKTKGKITDLVPPGSINPSSGLVITSVLYFNGMWLHQFEPDYTYDANFTTETGTKVRVNMMAKHDEFTSNYYEDDRLQAVEMPFTMNFARRSSMLVILPRGNNLTAVEKSFDTKDLTALRASLRPAIVYIDIPRYRVETEYQMQSVLGDMGMPGAFSGDADFSGINGTRDLFISAIVHKAFVNVYETGAEAAAGTAEHLETASLYQTPEPHTIYDFVADHPFIFIIQDEKTGNILFMGRVMNPNA
jgi:serpin B